MNKNRYMGMNITLKQHAALLEIAQAEQLSLSDVVRRAINEMLNRKEQKQEAK
jgi:predicted HicB family RNase H-like nuclease